MAGIYLHIPFCRHACHYCDFHFSTTRANMDEMVQAIHRELILRKEYLKGEAVSTIYFGGGTPSLLSFEQLTDLLNVIRSAFTVLPNAEITLETNPDDLSELTLQQFKSAGVNRLSIGIQSFFDAHLKLMNRAHDANQAKEGLKMAVKYFDNITIDLIYGIPGLTDDQWRENLKIAFDSGIDHLSSYGLTVEPKTALASMIKKKVIPEVDDAQMTRQFEILMELAAKNGFEHYEISNFARNGKYSRHNTSYWQGKKYLGVGPSAHSFDEQSRQWNVYNNQVYIRNLKEGTIPYEKEVLTKKDKYNEYILTGLRTMWGINTFIIKAHFGPTYLEYFQAQIEKIAAEATLEIDGSQITLSPKGKLFADKIASELFYS